MTGSTGLGPFGIGLLMLRLALSPFPVPLADLQRYSFDIAAKLQLVGGEGCPCLNLRFTNLGPSRSTGFTYQVVQYKWLATEKKYGTGMDLNTQGEGAVPALGTTASWQKNFALSLETPSSYLFKILYIPPLMDGNPGNHNIQLRYAFP